MKCPNCGTENAETARFCGKCGQEFALKASAPPQQAVQQQKPKKFVRCSDDKQIGGVCSGFAKYFDLDITMVRLVTILSFLFTGSATFWAYIITWIVVPEDVCGL